MNINIKNYKNLKELNYQIDDEKINFLFGLSGSGKSSILNALCSDDISKNKPFGTSDVDLQIAEINGAKVCPEEMHVFDIDKVQFIYSSNSIEPITEVIISDTTEHERIHGKLEDKLDDLNSALRNELNSYNEINEFLLSLKIKKLTKSNTLPATSLYSKAMTNIKSLSAKKMFADICLMDENYLRWLSNGFDFIKNQKCPFCSKKMAMKTIKKNSKYKSFDSSNLANLKKELVLHASLFSETISFQYSNLKYLEKDIISFAKAAETYAKINEQVFSMFDADYDYNNFKKVRLCSDFSKHFPLTFKEYKKLCSNVPKLKKAIKQTHIDTDIFLKNKKTIVNKLLEQLGIPYHFEVQYQRDGPNNYYIVHNRSLDEDNKESLSEGEKSIVILILFLVASSQTNYKLYMIDDPVSSYDCLRRKIIYNTIKNYLKGKTTIVFSHDPVFAKFALEDSNNKNIGKITYLSNNGDNPASLIQLKGKTLSSFEKSVVKRMAVVTSQYQKSILSRLLIEDEYGTISRKYGYLSKILHGVPYCEIMTFLSNIRINEMDLLIAINDALHNKGAPSNYLSPLIPTYNNIDISSFSIFEKCIVIRELINKKIITAPAFVKEELNNYVHLADMLDIIIDPFEFPIISRTLSDYIDSLPNKYTI